MKRVSFDQEFIKKLKVLKLRNPRIYTKIHKQLLLFQVDPRHPSLRTHQLQGKLQNVFSISINKSFRLVYLSNGEYLFFDLGFHSQIYRE